MHLGPAVVDHAERAALLPASVACALVLECRDAVAVRHAMLGKPHGPADYEAGREGAPAARERGACAMREAPSAVMSMPGGAQRSTERIGSAQGGGRDPGALRDNACR